MDYGGAGQCLPFQHMMSNGQIGCSSSRKPIAGKHEKHRNAGAQRRQFGFLTVPALMIAAGLEMSGTDRAIGLVDQQAIRTNSLITVMLQNNGLSGQKPQEELKKGGSRKVNDVAVANDTPQLKKAWSAHNVKRIGRFVRLACVGLRDNGHFEFLIGVVSLQAGKACGQGLHDVFNPSDARCEKVRIDEQFHMGDIPAGFVKYHPQPCVQVGKLLPIESGNTIMREHDETAANGWAPLPIL